MKKTERVGGVAPKFFRTINFAKLLMLAIAMVFVACNKDDDEGETLNFLEGSPSFVTPVYVMVGDTVTLTASGVVTEGASYTWSFDGLDSLTVIGEDKATIKLIVPDTLATFTVTVTADAGDEYYTSIFTDKFTSVGEGSLTGVEVSENAFVDPRDSEVYGYVKIGSLDWFTRNLNWAGAGQGYGKSKAAAFIFGRLYTWEDATDGVSASGLGAGVQGACPQGWSIPTKEDWEDLGAAINGGEALDFASEWKDVAVKLMAPALFNGENVWPYSPIVEITNDFGWNALAAGTGVLDYTQFSNISKYGFWWSGTEKDSKNAHYRYIYCEYPNVSVNYSTKDGMAASVRCVRLAK